jgi:sulfur-carrier protein
MTITLLFFGSLTDITTVEKVQVQDIADTDSLRKELNTRYPSMAKAKYFLAVNQELQELNCNLSDGDTVALMPPFSGG